MAMDSIYEVFSTPHAVVDTKEKTCTCKLWQINGLPCVHAATDFFEYERQLQIGRSLF